jgi:dipeptidyl aminopeptidase/acylaminoacyl peptidase
MSPFPLRALMLAAAVFAHAAVAAAPASAGALPPLADFFDNPAFSGALLSPSGKYLAIKTGGKEQRDRLAVIDLTTNETRIVGNFTDADVGDFEWVNDERLVYSTADNNRADGQTRRAPGLFAINRDGTMLRQLVSRTSSTEPVISAGSRSAPLLPWSTFLLGQKNSQRSEHIYVVHPEWMRSGELDYMDLQRLDTLTGRVVSFAHPDDTRGWLLDNNGEPRVAVAQDKGITTIHYRDPAKQQEWRKLVSFDTYSGGEGAFTPLAFGPDGTFYVISNAGKDKFAVHTFDFTTNTVSQKPLIDIDGYDFSGNLIMGQHKLLGVRHLTDAVGITWFDPAMKAMQDKIDQLLPHTMNLLTPPTRPETPWVLVTAYSDLFPSQTVLYNSATQTLSAVGSTHPGIKAGQMSKQTLVHYKARDGLDIPAWLTLPDGPGKNLPMVVLAHGGPFVRGNSWGWSANAQFLASRGYAVLEPEFRGSTGFGKNHFRAGWKQWGAKIQDDIADGTRWAIANGTADGARVCIAGFDFGGYSALMGLIKEGDLYKCGIDAAGMTDINLLYDGHSSFISDLPEAWKQYGMPQLVGDQAKDAELLKAASPLLQAARIKQPLLMAYGGADRRVPLPHGTKFYKAVKEGNPNVEWIEYDDEGHLWRLPKTRIDYWGRVEKFLAKNIGPR